MLVLFTDTDTDITAQEANALGYQLISMPYSIDGETTYPYEDFEYFDAHAFYDRLRSGVLPTTSAISEERYRNYFEPVFASGNDILYVHFSRAMTATFEGMDRAVAELKQKYPERKFYEIDTKGITIVSYNIAKEIAALYRTGKTAEELLAWAKEEVDRFAIYFFADDLRFFKRSGRVSGIAGTMGTLLGIRPIIHMNSEGRMVSIGKEKGRAKAIDRLVSYVSELGEHVEDHLVIVGHSDAPEIADEVIAELQARFDGKLNIEKVVVNPTAGSHCGPDGVGVCFHAKHR